MLLKLRMMEVVMTTGTIRRESYSQIVTTNKPIPNVLQAGCPPCRPNNSVTDGKNITLHGLAHPKLTRGLPTLSLTHTLCCYLLHFPEIIFMISCSFIIGIIASFLPYPYKIYWIQCECLVFLHCNRHPSGEFSYGNTSVTVKMMEQDGSFLPGEITRDLGYVSNFAGVKIRQCWFIYVILVFHTACIICFFQSWANSGCNQHYLHWCLWITCDFFSTILHLIS